MIDLGRVDGRRKRQKVSGQTKTEVQARLKDLQNERNQGIRTSATYTVRQCCEDWLAHGLPRRDPKTVEKNKYVLEPLLAVSAQSRRVRVP